MQRLNVFMNINFTTSLGIPSGPGAFLLGMRWTAIFSSSSVISSKVGVASYSALAGGGCVGNRASTIRGIINFGTGGCLPIFLITTRYGVLQGSRSTSAHSACQHDSWLRRIASLSLFLSSFSAACSMVAERPLLFALWYVRLATRAVFLSSAIYGVHQNFGFLELCMNFLFGIHSSHASVIICISLSGSLVICWVSRNW